MIDLKDLFREGDFFTRKENQRAGIYYKKFKGVSEMDLKTNNLTESTKTKEELIKEGCIVIRTWMITDLKLSGVKLLVFAIIYCLTDDNVSKCNLSLNAFRVFTGAGKTSIVAVLKELTASGLIIKNDINYTAGGVNEYWVNLQEIQKRIGKKSKCKK